MSAFIPTSGLTSVSGTSVERDSVVAPLRPAHAKSTSQSSSRSQKQAARMTAYPYTGSGYGGAGVPYANNPVGQFMTVTTTPNIVDTAASVPIFSQLVDCLVRTGLDYELMKGGPFTVFAPTDDAFLELLNPHGFSKFGTLLRPENIDSLREVLKYHVVPGELSSAGIAPLGGKVVAPTMAGETITVMGYGRHVTAGAASVVRADIPCSNGIIHVIDKVLAPLSYDPPAVRPPVKQYPDSIVSDVYGKMLTPRQALGIDPAPEGAGSITPY